MHILITGANGFVGSHLVQSLLKSTQLLSQTITRLSLMDLNFKHRFDDPRVQYFAGDISSFELIDAACNEPVDILFHLASIPGGMAEQNYELSRKVNLDATVYLLERLKQQANQPRVVFASTIAVYGSDLPASINDDTPLCPHLTYATQKLIGELLVSDFSRKGWIDGISIRLPGIVARPPAPSGLLSAFMSTMFWNLAKKEKFDCPVSANAVAWWMSVECCVNNLIHAAQIPREHLSIGSRAFTLPVLRLTMHQVISGLCEHFQLDEATYITYGTDIELEKNFGAYPEIETSRAFKLGFKNDGNLEKLIQNTLLNS